MGEYVVKTVRDISGGVREDLIDTPASMPDSTWAQLQNLEYNYQGAIVARGGASTPYNSGAISSATGIIAAVRYAKNASGTNTLLVWADHPTAQKMFQGNDSLGTFTQVTGTALTAGQAINWVVAKDIVYFTDGKSKIRFYNSGTGHLPIGVTSGTNYSGSLIAWADNALWMAGDDNWPNRVRASQDGLFDSSVTGPDSGCWWPDANYADVPMAGNDRIVALLSYDDELLVFRRKDIFIIEGTYLDWSMRRIENVGTYDQRSVYAASKYGIYWVGPEGIFWKANVNAQTINIGRAIWNTFKSNSWNNSAIGLYSKRGFVYFTYSTVSTASPPDKCVVWDVEKMRWMGPHTFGAAGFVEFDGANDTRAIYRLASASGVVYQMDDGTNQDNGVNFTCQAKTKYFDLDDVASEKLCRTLKMGVNAATNSNPLVPSVVINRGQKTNSFPVYTIRGFSSWGTFWFGRDKYGGGGYNTAAVPFKHGSKGREFQIVFSKTDNYALELYDYSIEYKQETYRRRT